MELVLDTVRKTFGGVVAVDDVSAVMPRDKVTALIGPNGAGKTTPVQRHHRLRPPGPGVDQLRRPSHRRPAAVAGGRTGAHQDLPDPGRVHHPHRAREHARGGHPPLRRDAAGGSRAEPQGPGPRTGRGGPGRGDHRRTGHVGPARRPHRRAVRRRPQAARVRPLLDGRAQDAAARRAGRRSGAGQHRTAVPARTQALRRAGPRQPDNRPQPLVPHADRRRGARPRPGRAAGLRAARRDRRRPRGDAGLPRRGQGRRRGAPDERDRPASRGPRGRLRGLPGAARRRPRGDPRARSSPWSGPTVRASRRC